MEVRFEKTNAGRTCSWAALRPPRTRVPGTTMAAGGDLPHDLSTFVIEQALGIEHGFWGCVAEGATFKTLGRRRTPQGRSVIKRNVEHLDAAERRVNEVYGAWKRGETTDAGRALDSMLDRWRTLGEGEQLVLTWEPASRARARRRR